MTHIETISKFMAEAGYENSTITRTESADFGDYQCADALSFRTNGGPRVKAQSILDSLPKDARFSKIEVAGPGYINFTLSEQFLIDSLEDLITKPSLGCAATNPEKIIVDFSSPNAAKVMHVGHLRSTVIGDCLVRMAKFAGHEVISDNHIGDWGAQFGKLIYGWRNLLDSAAWISSPVEELTRIYRAVNALEKDEQESDEKPVTEAVRTEALLLQTGDPDSREIWAKITEVSLAAMNDIYSRLGVGFDYFLGESEYALMLDPLVSRLMAGGVAESSQGAACIFFRDIPELCDNPCIVQKSNGGFLYSTTDLATIEYRIHRWAPNAIWYVVGAPQTMHFQQVFAAASKMGHTCNLSHVSFGNILGADRKMMRTRDGENVSLSALLDQGLERALALVVEKSPELAAAEQFAVAEAVSVAAIKFAELSQNRTNDYVFLMDKMVAFDGKTGPYLQSACVRLQSIFRAAPTVEPGAIYLKYPSERMLALRIIQFPEAFQEALDAKSPSVLADHLYLLARAIHSFYRKLPVNGCAPVVRSSRTRLCQAALKTLTTGLSLMGISVPERM